MVVAVLQYFLNKLAVFFISVKGQIIQPGLGDRHNQIDCRVGSHRLKMTGNGL